MTRAEHRSCLSPGHRAWLPPHTAHPVVPGDQAAASTSRGQEQRTPSPHLPWLQNTTRPEREPELFSAKDSGSCVVRLMPTAVLAEDTSSLPVSELSPGSPYYNGNTWDSLLLTPPQPLPTQDTS